MDEEFLIKRVILEQACYFFQHNIIQHFMPEDITTYGLHPALPAMAALHKIINNCHSDHETGKAVILLNYVHSLIPSRTPELEKDYVDLLISLKSKAVFYEVFTCDHSCGEQQHMMDIMEKYFGEDEIQSNSAAEDSSEESYIVQSHRSMRQAIKGFLVSRTERRNFQTNVLLQSSRSKSMYEDLVAKLEIYLINIRKMLPTPQLIKDYLDFKDTGSGDEDNDNTDCAETEGDFEQLQSSSPSACRKGQIRVALKKPKIHLTRLRSRPTLTHNLNSPLPSYSNDTSGSDSQNDNTSDYDDLHKHRQNDDTSDYDDLRDHGHHDDTSDCDDLREYHQIQSPTTPRQYKTPAAPHIEMEMKKMDPKENRVMGSIARKRKFLAGSSTTSSDDSSCSFLSLKKPRLTRPFSTSQEVPLAHRKTSFQQKMVENGERRYHYLTRDSPQLSSTNVQHFPNKRSSLSIVHKHSKVNTGSNRACFSAASSPSTKSSGLIRHIHRRNPRKRAMVHFELASDFVSDSDSESPLKPKATPLHGLTKTLQRIS